MHAIVDRDMLTTTRRRWLRPALMLLGPLVVLAIGGWYWLSSGGSVATDNAYVQQDKVSISSDVTGRVLEVPVVESQHVKKGDVLYRLSPLPFQIALDQANAAVAEARLQVAGLRQGTTGKDADVAGKREAVAFARIDLERQQNLLKDGFTTRARLQMAEHTLTQAQSELASAMSDAASARTSANFSGTHPLILAALAQRDKAALDLARSVIRAPADGIASQTDKVQVGQIGMAGLPTMSVVISDKRYVEANFKETDLEHMRVGQPATVKLDAYPSVPLKGRVDSIGAGTGSEFSVLPAQNATGNWVKVVQRVPVRIVLTQATNLPLIAGLSASVTVETAK
ncbi:MAG: HlyD family secretion protein [Polymorphobacter sp.]